MNDTAHHFGGRSDCQRTPILAPRIYEGVPEGRGESEYLRSKYSEMPTFL